MKGSITQRANGKWRVRIFRGTGADGKKHWDSYTLAGTKKQAEQFLRRKLAEMDTGAYVPPARVTFGEHVETWLRDYVQLRLRQITAESYESVLRLHALPALGTLSLDRMSPKDLLSLYAAKKEAGLGPTRVRYLHTIIHGCLKHAVKWGLLARNIAESVDPPRKESVKPLFLKPQEVGVLLEASQGHRLEIPILLAVTGGLRRSEIIGLRWSEVNLDAGTITVVRAIVPVKKGTVVGAPKTKNGRRTIPMPAMAIEKLREHREKQNLAKQSLGDLYVDEDYVCANELGQPLRPWAASHAFSRLIQKTNLPPVSLHDLRHSHASLLLWMGVHPKVVQERLGQGSITITMDIYSHVMPTLQQEAADKLNDVIAPPQGANTRPTDPPASSLLSDSGRASPLPSQTQQKSKALSRKAANSDKRQK